MSSRNGLLGLLLCGASAACGAEADDDDTVDGDPDAGADGDADADGDGDGDGPTIRIHVRSSTAVFPHTDDWAGQTPRAYASGYRSFRMLRDIDDPEPLVVFDHGQGFVEAGYADGEDTVVGSAIAAELVAGHFTLGRTVMSHVRYTVDTTMHLPGQSVLGELASLQILSDGTTVDGETHDLGWYRTIFRAGAFEVPREGSDAALGPQAPGGIGVEVVGAETVFTFPIDIDVVPDVASDVDMIFEVNSHDCFRWEDQDTEGYAVGVFDTEPGTFEPVRQFGANSFAVYTE